MLSSRLPDGSTVLLDPETELYFGLDEIGALVWSELAEGRSPPSILADLVDTFDAEHDEIERGLSALLDDLVNEGLIVADQRDQNSA